MGIKYSTIYRSVMIGTLSMSKKPLVSVIIPAYNAERYIARAIKSILVQTFKNFELIVINDASTDNVLKILKKYQRLDKRIHIINNKENLQIAASLNKAVRTAQAEIIARMDADDRSFPNRLELQYSFLKKNTDVAVVGADIVIIDEKGNPISKREYPTTSKELKKVMFRYSPFAHPVVMFRKKIFLEFGGYDLKMVPCEDIDLWFKIGSRYKFASIPRAILKYTILPESSSNKKLIPLELLGFRIKINAIRKYGYKPGLYDLIYNLGEFITLWFMPVSIRVWTYNFLRSKKFI